MSRWPDPTDLDPSEVVYVNGNQENAARRPGDEPAPTVMFGARSNKVEWQPADGPPPIPDGETAETGRWVFTGGNQANATVREADEPAPTVAFGHNAAQFGWMWAPYEEAQPMLRPGHRAMRDGQEVDLLPTDEPAPVVTSRVGRWHVEDGYPTHFDRRTNSRDTDGSLIPTVRVPVDQPAPTLTGAGCPAWATLEPGDNTIESRRVERSAPPTDEQRQVWGDRPATTVQGDQRIGDPGHKCMTPDCHPDRGTTPQFSAGGVRVTVAEAAVLQSFPATYPWQGTKTVQYQQVGNAVPPRLGAHVLAEASGHPLLAFA